MKGLAGLGGVALWALRFQKPVPGPGCLSLPVDEAGALKSFFNVLSDTTLLAVMTKDSASEQ